MIMTSRINISKSRFDVIFRWVVMQLLDPGFVFVFGFCKVKRCQSSIEKH